MSFILQPVLSKLFFCVLSVTSAGSLQADDVAQPEKLPPPKESAATQVIEVDPVLFMEFPHRQSRYAVWDFYGVDRTGHFRPRVIYSPYGPYYLYNGEPYPWVTTHERDIMPYVVGE